MHLVWTLLMFSTNFQGPLGNAPLTSFAKVSQTRGMFLKPVSVQTNLKIILTTPTPHISKKCDPNIWHKNDGSYGIKIPWNKGTFRMWCTNRLPRGPYDWKNSIPTDRVKFPIHTLQIFNPYAWKFQSRLKFSISIENFNPDLDNSPHKGALLCGSVEIFNLDWKFQSEIGRLKISIPEQNLEIFQSLGPLGFMAYELRLLWHSNPPFYQEPLNAPFLNGLFSSGFSRRKTAPWDEIGETPH